MSNMSYCRFENTVGDLKDCAENLFDTLDNEHEIKARARLVKIAHQIAADCPLEEIDSLPVEKEDE